MFNVSKYMIDFCFIFNDFLIRYLILKDITTFLDMLTALMVSLVTLDQVNIPGKTAATSVDYDDLSVVGFGQG